MRPYVNAQYFECAHTLTPDQRSELADEQNNSETRDATCFDDEWTGENQTYKIVLEYSTVYTDPNDPDDPDYMTSLVEAMSAFYLQYGIILDILILPNELDLIDPTVDGWAVNGIDDCITGKIVREADPSTNGAGNADGSTGSNFWVKDDPSPNGAIHELGHVLSLHHTHGPLSDLFDITDNSNNEAILFDVDEDGTSEYTDCNECNCKSTGDRVCDTPVDPTAYFPTIGAADWRAEMFDYNVNPPQIINSNSDNITDKCGANYADMSPEDQYKVFNNVMGQHANFMDIDPFLSDGQVERIKSNNIGKSWTVDGDGGMMVACEGFTVDSPMVIDTDKLITSDVIVNSKLTFLNANVKFSAGVEIILNEGAWLVIDTSSLDTDACVSGGLWGGMRIVGDQETTRIDIIRGSSINGISQSAITCNNAELLLNIDNGSSMNCLGFNVIDANNSNLAFQINTSSQSTNTVFLKGNVNLNNSNGWIDAKNANFTSGNTTIPNMISRFDSCFFFSYDVTLNNSIGFKNAYFLNKTTFSSQSKLNIENLNGVLTMRNSFFTEGVTLGNINDFDIGLNNINSFNLELLNETANDNQNIIVQNRFFGNPEGILLDGQNNDGLSIDCNRFLFTSGRDIAIQSGSIAENQGEEFLAAGNKFTSGITNIFGNEATNINYYYDSDDPFQNPNVIGDEIEKIPVLEDAESKCEIPYPYLPYPSHCYDEVQNANETGVDCGGSCGSCVDPNVVSIGPNIIGPVYASCSNGVQDGDETDIDCGGSICPPCGPMFVNTCYNGILDGNETSVDCGGSCDPCEFTYTNEGPINNQNQQAIQDNETDFVTMVSDIYGTDIIELGDDIDINDDLLQLDALLDNGNTEQLVNFINANSAFNNASVINALNEISPYVSSEAIHSLFNHIDHYNVTDIVHILKSNPGLLSDSYIKYMVFQSGRLNSNQIDQIKIANRNSNDRTILQEKIRIKRMYMYYLIRERISLEMSDHNPNWGAVRAQLLKKDHRDALYQIYETFVSERNFSFASQYLDVFDPNDIQIPFYQQQLSSFQALHQILLQYYYEDNRTTAIPTSVQHQLEMWANGCYGKTTIKAKAVLKELLGIAIVSNNNCNPYQTINKPQNRTVPLETPSVVSDAIFTLSPNPATNSIHISTDLEINSDDVYILTIFNAMGSKIQELHIQYPSVRVDINKFESGVYMYQIIKNNELLQSNKFIKID